LHRGVRAGQKLPDLFCESPSIDSHRVRTNPTVIAGSLWPNLDCLVAIRTDNPLPDRWHDYCADDRTCAYFALHRVADIHHSNVWRKIISALVEQDERHAEEALQGVSRAARALWTALDGIERDISALAN
jgi:Iron-containing redox enzyme